MIQPGNFPQDGMLLTGESVEVYTTINIYSPLKKKNMTTNNNPDLAEFVSVECEKMKVNLANAGEFVKVNQASESLKSYLKDPRTPPEDDLSHIFGHVFGINKLKKVMLDIEIFNSRQLQDAPKIAALKFYYGISKRNDPDFPLKPENGEFRDLIVMPVLDNGEDLHKIRGLYDDEVLSGSRPCPNQCGNQIFLNR